MALGYKTLCILNSFILWINIKLPSILTFFLLNTGAMYEIYPANRIKMSTIVGILMFLQDKFHAQLS